MQPVIPLFEDPEIDFNRELSIPPEVRTFVRDMREQGGAVLDLGEKALALCDQAASDARRMLRSGRRVQDAWRRSRAVRALALNPRLHRALSTAYGRRSFPFQTLNFEVGSEQDLHTDVIHFSSVPPRFMCGVWIALEDVRPGSGPLVYYPGSHRLPLLTMRDVGVNSDNPTDEDYERHFVPRFAEAVAKSGLPAKELRITKGQAFVWAANLAHGGAAIADPKITRRSLVVHCYFDDCLYFTPMTSDEAGGRLSLRVPPDVRTGGFRWPKHEGRRVAIGWRAVVNAVRALTASPHVS